MLVEMWNMRIVLMSGGLSVVFLVFFLMFFLVFFWYPFAIISRRGEAQAPRMASKKPYGDWTKALTGD